ncbi:MAG: AI-2E family transporter [Planctomycetes bacterium]|nr:AI-2E family transporter [Planctomycetota bacterium]
MPRVVSFIVLLAIILLIGSMFFQVMVQFIVPLFLAAVLVVIFKPLHRWMLKKCGDRPRVSAALTTLAIVLIVLLPITGMLIRAVTEGVDLYGLYASSNVESEIVDPLLDPSSESPSVEPTEHPSAAHQVIEKAATSTNKLFEKFDLPTIDPASLQSTVNDYVHQLAAPLAVGSVKMLVGTLFGLAIMVLTLYYFFADGPNMVAALMKLSPLDDNYEQELLDKFGDVSRAVVVAVLLSAIIQGLLAGVGYYFAGVEAVFFLTAATAFLAMVPFVGAAAVWIPVCVVLYFYTGNVVDGVAEFPDGRPTAAIVLAIFCGTVVSMSDNIVKPLVLHGQSNLHPLLALLSVIGGIQTLGPIGILVGPMLVAFLQALLNMLNKELHLLGQEADEKGTPVVFATGAPDETPKLQSPQTTAKKSRRSKKKR